MPSLLYPVLPVGAGLGSAPALMVKTLAGVALRGLAPDSLDNPMTRIAVGRTTPLLDEAAAAERLAGAIRERVGLAGSRGDSFRRDLASAARLSQSEAPLLHHPVVRGALADALAGMGRAAA